MATASLTVQPVSWFKPKYLLIGLFGLMVAYVLGHNESFLVNPNAPVWQHYQPFKWWLLPHGIAGACAFVLAPMQFSDRLRQRYAKLHRVSGRVYVAGAFIAGLMGVYIQVIPICLRVCACPHAVLRPAAPALCEIASCVRKGLCCRRVHRRSDGDLYPGNSTPHGSSAVFHHGRRDPWHLVDADHRDRLCVDPQAKDSAAPSVDDPQLFRGPWGLSRSALGSGRDRLGKSWSGGGRNRDMDVSGLLHRPGRRRAASAGTAACASRRPRRQGRRGVRRAALPSELRSEEHTS